MLSSRLTLLLLAGMVVTGVSAGQSQIQDISCYHCHSKQVKDYAQSIHSENNITCIDCHGGEAYIKPTVSITAMYTNFTGVPSRVNITRLCAKCHIDSDKLYRESIHWRELNRGVDIAATCTDCHGAHNILPRNNPNSLTNPENEHKVCASCHDDQAKMQAWYYGISTDRFDTYKKSYHSKAYVSGGKVIATCHDCHENHDIRPENDPRSAIYRDNLPSTCGKTNCHPGANNVYIYGGKVHEGQSVYLLSSIFPIDAKKLVTYFYIVMILFELAFTLGLIFLGITSKFELRRRG